MAHAYYVQSLVPIFRACPLATSHFLDTLTSLSLGSCQVINYNSAGNLGAVPQIQLDRHFDEGVLAKLNSPQSCWNVITSNLEDATKLKNELLAVRSILLVSNEVVPMNLGFELHQFFKNKQFQDKIVLHCAQRVAFKFIESKDFGPGLCPFHFTGQEIQVREVGSTIRLLEIPK